MSFWKKLFGRGESKTAHQATPTNMNEIRMQMTTHLDRMMRGSRPSGAHPIFLKNLEYLRTPDCLDYAADTIASQIQKLERKPESIVTDWRKFPDMIVSASTISTSSEEEAVRLFPRGYLHFLEDLFRQCGYIKLDLPFAHWACTCHVTVRKIHLSLFPQYSAPGDEKVVSYAIELMSEAQRAYIGGRTIS